MKGTYYEQPFLKHFLDAIVLCEMAEDLPLLAMSRHSSLARTSIMASTLSLEAAANMLMSPIRAPRRLIELVDQGQVLDKYEFVLFGTGRHRPIGLVANVTKQLFFNAVLAGRREDRDVVLTVLLDSGEGREIRLTLQASRQFLQSVEMNRRRDWYSEGVSDAKPETIETKGRDYEVEEVDIITFDPRSKTVFWTYKARSKRVVQANMQPSTLISIFDIVHGAVLRFLEDLPHNSMQPDRAHYAVLGS